MSPLATRDVIYSIFNFAQSVGLTYFRSQSELHVNPTSAPFIEVTMIAFLLKRPVGGPPRKPAIRFTPFEYRAATWDKPRRVVVKVEWHRGEMFPRVGFIVTNLNGWAGDVFQFYNQRGTAEQWIKEGKYALK